MLKTLHFPRHLGITFLQQISENGATETIILCVLKA